MSLNPLDKMLRSAIEPHIGDKGQLLCDWRQLADKLAQHLTDHGVIPRMKFDDPPHERHTPGPYLIIYREPGRMPPKPMQVVAYDSWDGLQAALGRHELPGRPLVVPLRWALDAPLLLRLCAEIANRDGVCDADLLLRTHAAVVNAQRPIPGVTRA